MNVLDGLDLDGARISTVGDPVNPGDAATRRYVDGKFGTPVRRTVALLGDSITIGSINPTAGDGGAHQYSFGYWQWADLLTRSRLNLIGPAGVSGGAFGLGGLTTVTLVSGGYVAAAAAVDVDAVVVLIGSNDIAAGTAVATILSNIQGIWATLRATGKQVIACTLPPRAGTSGENQALRDLNRLIRTAALARGIRLCDWYHALVDATTGAPSSGVLSDGVHPNSVGAARLGSVLASTLQLFAGDVADPLGFDNVDTADALANGMFVGSSSGLATGWSNTAAGGAVLTNTKVARGDLAPGEWQQVVCVAPTPGTDGYTLQAATVTTGFAAGDRFVASVEFETDAAGWDCRAFWLQLYAVGASSYGSGVNEQSGASAAAALWRPPSGVLRTAPLTVPASPTQLLFQIIVRGGSTIRYGRAQLIKVA